MIETKVIRDLDEIKGYIPGCQELAKKAHSTLSSHQLQPPLIWWEHFHTVEGEDFGKRRGRNLWGQQSSVEDLMLVVAEDQSGLCGIVPMVSVKVKITRGQDPINLLMFPGDSVLIPYQDLLVLPGCREEAIPALLSSITELACALDHAILLSYIPQSSDNLPILRKYLTKLSNDGLCVGEALNQRRGGVHPWTIGSITYHLRKLAKQVETSLEADVQSLAQALDETSQLALSFPGTSRKLEEQVRGLVEMCRTDGEDRPVLAEIEAYLEPMAIPHPYIELPDTADAYFGGLSKETRRYFRRYKRRFEEQGGTFEKKVGRSITPQDIEDYLELHLARWQSESAALSDRTHGFHTELSTRMSDLDRFCLFFAEYRGKRIAVHSCFDIGDRREGYFTGRDMEFDETRAGRLLYMETILDAIQEGFRVYDLGYGGDAYKLSFTDTVATTSHVIIAKPGKMPDLQRLFPRYEYVELSQAASSMEES